MYSIIIATWNVEISKFIAFIVYFVISVTNVTFTGSDNNPLN